MITDSQKVRIGQEYAKAFGVELVKQGRTRNSGGLINSLKAKATRTGFEVLGNYYWRFVDKGVKASSIRKPFAPPRINALIDWLKKKGIGSSLPIIRGIAYAIAYTHSQYGMPVKNGRIQRQKLNFVDKALNRDKDKIDKVITQVLGRSVDTIINKIK